MDDLISRQAAIDALEEPCKVPDSWTDEYDIGERAQYEKDVKALNRLPSADVVEVRHGRWKEFSPWRSMFSCSVCGHWGEEFWNYCPSCGTRMDQEENE